ncbi:hypothetical protein [Paenibacillus silviterrae]|uniref:hypothetical protein n=1 Tax=Paenibacillus silviterrae TaxID=3242194 RepID=UPI002542D46B|nr:hypothetical protein [Paenibacillus chinjuensis]
MLSVKVKTADRKSHADSALSPNRVQAPVPVPQAAISSSSIAQLQKAYGNQAVSRYVSALYQRNEAPPIQRSKESEKAQAEMNSKLHQEEEESEEQAEEASSIPDKLELTPASLPSETHFLENAGKNYKQLASKELFSLCKKSIMAADLTLINEYIANYTEDKPVGNKVTHRRGATSSQIEYVVNGRTYSTHKGTAQLYPVSGTDVKTGKGPVAVGKLLRELKALTEDRKVGLYQIVMKNNSKDEASEEVEQESSEGKEEMSTRARGVNQLGKQDKIKFAKAFDELIKN